MQAATRRELVIGGLALGALAGAGSLAATAGAQVKTQTDAELLLPVVGIELLAVFAYQQVLNSQLMSAEAQLAATRMLGHEHAHVRTFANALVETGGTPPPALASVKAADDLLALHNIPNRLGHLITERDCITVLVRIEQVLEGVYFTAISKLSDPRLAGLSAQVLASEAQHYSVLNLLLRPRNTDLAVPGSFVLGTH